MPVQVLLLSLLFAAFLPVSASAQTPSGPPRLEIPYTQFTLANGLSVIVHEDHSVPLVTVNVFAPVPPLATIVWL